MTKRKPDDFEKSLREFAYLFRNRINEDIKFWKNKILIMPGVGKWLILLVCLN